MYHREQKAIVEEAPVDPPDTSETERGRSALFVRHDMKEKM